MAPAGAHSQLHEQRRHEYRFVIRQLKDYRWEHEQQLVTQRRLLERLRYKQYVKHGTLGTFKDNGIVSGFFAAVGDA